MKRLAGVFALFILATLPAVAVAHQGNPNYRSEINSIEPAALADGLTVEIVNFDDHVRLSNDTGKEVMVGGYDGEPLARISADGRVEVNLNSPAYYLNEDRFADVEVPERADADADPDWKEVGGNGIYEWHDHRSHYMGTGTPVQVNDESEPTKVFDYRIPISVAGRPARIDGTLTWVGKDDQISVIPFVILGLGIAAAIAFWLVRRRRGRADEQRFEESGQAEPDREGRDPRQDKEAW